jgi:hypothetical protein
MRKVTRQVCEAFVRGEKKTVGNTYTNGNELRLHGNLIARKENGQIILSDCGWQTVTTKERLNGLLDILCAGAGIYQKKFCWYLWNRKTGQEYSWNREAVVNCGNVVVL